MKYNPPNYWINENHDTDRDGVPNYRDCNPWNPHEQGLGDFILRHRKLEKIKIGKNKDPTRYYKLPKRMIDTKRREKYYCPKCDIYYDEEKCPKCGSAAKLKQRRKQNINKMRFRGYQIPGVDEINR